MKQLEMLTVPGDVIVLTRVEEGDVVIPCPLTIPMQFTFPETKPDAPETRAETMRKLNEYFGGER